MNNESKLKEYNKKKYIKYIVIILSILTIILELLALFNIISFIYGLIPFVLTFLVKNLK